MNTIFQRVVQNMLAIKSLITIPRLLSGIIQTYGIIQPLAIVLLIDFKHDVKHLIWLELLQPEIILLKYCQIDQGLMYLFVLILFIIQKLLLLILHFKMKDICYQTNRNNVCAVILQFIGSYQRIYIPYLIQPFTLICALSFQHNLTFSGITHLIFSFVTFILIEIEYFVILLVAEQSITYKVSYLDKIKITIFDLLSYFSKLSQIFVLVFATQYQYFLQFQLTLLLINSGSEIFNQLYNQIYILKQQRYITYFVNPIVFLFSLLRLVMIINFDTKRIITIFSILYPLMLNILLQIDKYIQNDYQFTFYQNYSQKQLNRHLHYLYRFINNCKTQNDQNLFMQSLIYNKHRQYCVDLHCICQITFFMNNAQSANPISLKMMNHLIYNRIMDIFDLKNNIKSTQSIKLVTTSLKLELTVICGKLLFDCGYYWQSVQYFSSIVDNTSVDQDQNGKIMAPPKVRNQFSNLHIGEIPNQRILFILQQAKKQIKLKFEYIQIDNSENPVTLDVNSFLINELRLFESLNIIISLIKQQKSYYQFLLSVKLDYNSLSYKIMDYGRILIKTEKLLLVYFHQNPIMRLKSLICYFYAQIQNNYLKSYQISNLATISDEKQFKFISRLSSSASQTGYVFLSVNEDMQNLTIEFNSPIFQSIADSEKNSKDFNILVPEFLKDLHQHQVSTFLETGVGTYFRNFGHTFIRSQNGLIKHIQMCYDHCQILHQQKLVFVSFIQEIENNQQFVLVANNKFVGLSNNFLISVGFTQDKIDLIMKYYQFSNIPIQYIMPQFETYVSTELIQDRWEGEVVNFFNPQKLFNLVSYHLQDLQLVNQLWSKRENINRFCADITIIKRKVQGQDYFYVYFEKIKKIFGHSITFVSSQTQQLQYQDISDDSLDMDFIEEDIQTKRIHVLQIQPSQRQSQMFGTQRSILNRNETKEDNNFLLQKGLGSEASRRIDTHYQIQQEFFSEANILNNSIDSNIPVVQKSNNHINKLSQSSSNGFRGSKYFRKFEIIDNFMSKRTPTKLYNLLIIFLVLDFVFVLFSVCVFSVLQSDQTKFIKEIDLISFHASIMGPHDLFYSMRLTIQHYEDMLSLGLITHEQENSLNSYNYEHIKYGFDDLQSSFYQLMTNKYVKEVLNSYTLNILYFNQTLETSLRECLLILLNYQFDLKLAMETEDYSLNNPYQIFDQSNFALIHTVLEKATREMHQESINRSKEIQIKWNTIWIMFLIVSCVFGLGCSIYYQIYIKQFDKILGLSTLIKKQQLQEEIKRLSILSQNLKENNNLLYHYNLDLEHFDQEQNTNKNQEFAIIKAQTLTKYTNLFYLFLFLSTFCTYSTLINQNSSNYLSKYGDTSEFYKLISDLKLSNIVLFKEILLTPNQIDHMNSESIDSLYSYIQLSEQNILKFTQLISLFDETKYLVSTNFIEFLQLITKDNLCNHIQLEFMDFMEKYCDLSFEGSLRKGMINALGYELNLVKTEQAINNFTKREFYPLYENEGSQIIQRVFFILSAQFKSGLLDITDVQINLSQSLSISFLIFNGLICIIFIYYYKNYQIKEYQLFRRVICLIPQKILLYDNYFDRQFRQIILSQNFE